MPASLATSHRSDPPAALMSPPSQQLRMLPLFPPPLPAPHSQAPSPTISYLLQEPLASVPASILAPLQSVPSLAAEQSLPKCKSDHVIPQFRPLQWLTYSLNSPGTLAGPTVSLLTLPDHISSSFTTLSTPTTPSLAGPRAQQTLSHLQNLDSIFPLCRHPSPREPHDLLTHLLHQRAQISASQGHPLYSASVPALLVPLSCSYFTLSLITS